MGPIGRPETSVKIAIKFNVHGSMRCKNIPIYIQQDATLYSLFYLDTAVHVSDGASTHHQERIQLSTASVLCHTVIATCRYRGRAAGSNNSVTNTRCCRYSCLRS
jgi:hypothetical protein